MAPAIATPIVTIVTAPNYFHAHGYTSACPTHTQGVIAGWLLYSESVEVSGQGSYIPGAWKWPTPAIFRTITRRGQALRAGSVSDAGD